MEVFTYRAQSMQEALSLVRRELGPDAAVLHTREVQLRRFFGCLRGPTQIEITAGRGVNVPSRLPADEREEFSPPHEDASLTYSRPRPATPSSLLRPVHDPRPDNSPVMQEQISDLQAMVKELCKQSKSRSGSELPEELFHLFTSLIDADVSEDLARELVDRLRREVRGGELLDPLMLQARIARMIESDIRASGPLAITPGKCRVVALVGPTGVGKTTTIAKLAANFRLKEKRRVGLITVDTYRIAAVEQLRTYADIIDLPMEVVSTPKEMRQAVGRMAEMDLVLIDTAGRSPKDEVRLQELKAFLTEAGTDEVHLVLSSVVAWRTLEKTAEQFSIVGTTAVILTKLDEANGLGNVLPVLRSSRLPLSYMTDGQNVPDDIEVADSSHLAKLVLGMEAMST
jgi:flagellar biosynthesis protein FlhF